MNISPETYYIRQLDLTRQQLKQVKHKIQFTGTLRLVNILAILSGIYLLWGNGIAWYITTLIAGLIPFMLLIRYHNRLFLLKDFLEAKIRIYIKESQLQQYDFSGTYPGNEFIDPSHPFTYDLDVFGEKSLFAYIDRSASKMGRLRLASWLCNPLNTSQEIKDRQEAITELSEMNETRNDFLAHGMTSQETESDPETINNLADIPSFSTNRIISIFISSLPYIYGILLIFWVLGYITGNFILFLFLTLIFISLLNAKKVSSVQAKLDKALKSLSVYTELIYMLENSHPESRLLNEIREKIICNEKPVSVRIRKLNKLLNNLDQRFNIVGYVVLNGFLLWDMRQLNALDKWLRENSEKLPAWFSAISDFDALCSLATFKYNHPAYIIPQICKDHSVVMEAQEMGHPLIPVERCVKNDLYPLGHSSFLIITGANMAGKSTYLRTVGINYLLACIGAPVCAAEMNITPHSLFTGLRTTDSLSDNESYFFAELKRLQQVVGSLKSGKKMFIILDEILKGTNSTDKQIGSLALIRQLTGLGATGIIATHDLALGKLAEEFPASVRNFRFEASIHGDELSFSYRIQPGVAQNMNACFLMKKMGIIPPDKNPQ